jgi:quinol monooxygenase YgiN
MNTPIHTHVSHEVENFATWKPAFDAHEAKRNQYGIKTHGIYQAHDNPNMVTVHTEMPDMAAMEGFMTDPAVQATMHEAGVIGRPEMRMMTRHS